MKYVIALLTFIMIIGCATTPYIPPTDTLCQAQLERMKTALAETQEYNRVVEQNYINEKIRADALQRLANNQEKEIEKLIKDFDNYRKSYGDHGDGYHKQIARLMLRISRLEAKLRECARE